MFVIIGIFNNLLSKTYIFCHFVFEVNLGSNQYLFSVVVDPKEMPGFCLRHDVDALLWQPHSRSQRDLWEHIATFNALGMQRALPSTAFS